MGIPIYTPFGWVDDDGSSTTGTPISAARMNQLEGGVAENSRRTRVVRAAATKNFAGPLGPISQGGNPTIDGVNLVDGDRILLTAQTNSSQNGIYLYNFFPANGLQGSTWTLGRAVDFDTSAKIQSGQVIFVLEGFTNAGRTFAVTTSNPVIGTTGIGFLPIADRVLLIEQTQAANGIMDIPNIPQNYTHLELEFLVDSTRVQVPASSNTGMRIWFNGDRAAHYHCAGRNQGSLSPAEVNTVNDSWGYLGQMPAAQTGTATPHAQAWVHLPYYSDSAGTSAKIAHVKMFCGITEGGFLFHGSFLRFGDNAGISRIQVSDDVGGGVRAGSFVRVYGIRV